MRRCIELAGYLLLLAAIEGAGGQYTTGANDGRWVVKCAIEGQSDVDWIQHLADSDGLDVWDHHVSQTAGAMVTAMGSLPVVQKLQSKLRCTERQSAKALEQRVQKIPNDPGAVVDFFANYRSYNEIEQKLRSYSNDQLDLSIEIAAHSHEGRNISVIRMQSKHAHPNKKIWIGCGQHAREWIAPASCMYLVDAIAKGAGTKNSPFDQILTEYQLLVAPLVNPDGYEYSRLKDRYWRKNRRNNGPREKAGVDLNRNWPNRWGPIGTSANPSSDIYKGPSAGSEPEVSGIVRYLKGKTGLAAGIDVHSYGELILRSYGWTTEPSPNEEFLKPIGDAIADNMNAKNNENYESQRSGELYPAAGAMDDWIYEQAKAPIGMTFEMRDKGNNGFLLPPSNIVPTGKELIEGFLTLVSKISQKAGTRE